MLGEVYREQAVGSQKRSPLTKVKRKIEVLNE